MVYLWHSRTGVDNLDKALNHIKAVTWGSAAVPSAFQIIAVSMYNSHSVRICDAPMAIADDTPVHRGRAATLFYSSCS